MFIICVLHSIFIENLMNIANIKRHQENATILRRG